MSNDFHGLDPDEFSDPELLALQMAAQLMVRFFRLFQEEGLSVQEAAALTAAAISQSMPWSSPKPLED